VLHRRRWNPVREDLLTGSILDIDITSHTLKDVRKVIVLHAFVISYRVFVFTPSALRRFSRLVMAQVANIALYTSCTRPLLYFPKEKKRKQVSATLKATVMGFTRVSCDGKVQEKSYRIASHMLYHVKNCPFVSR
jgi:hypothetical protein